MAAEKHSPAPGIRGGRGREEASLVHVPASRYSCNCRFSDFDLFGQRGIPGHQCLDLAHGVQHRGVVASAEPAADLGQRTQRQRLGQIHRDLTRPNHVRGPPRRQQVRTADIVLPGDHPLDVLDLDPLRFLRTDQVAHLALGHFQRHRLGVELGVGEQAVDGAFEVAAVMGDGARQIVQHRFRHVEARVMRAGRRHARLQDSEPQFFAERTHLHDEAAGQPRAHAIVEAFEIGRRTVGGDHHLAAGIDQRVQRVAELGLGRLALQELQIVDHEHVDAAQRFLERQRRLRLQRGDEAVHELLGGEIEHLALAAGIAGPRHRLQQMGFAEADAGVNVERVEHHGIAAASFGDLARGRMGQRVGAADHEACKGQARVERRAAERIMAGGNRRGRGRAQFGRGPAIGVLDAALIGRCGGFLGGRGAAHRRAHGEVDPVHFRHLGLPAGQDTVGVMRLDPALEEPGRNRQMHAFVLHALPGPCAQTSSYRRLRPHSSATVPSRATSDPVPYLSLPENFSERVMVFAKSPGGSPCRFPARRDLDAELQPPDIDQPFGEIAVAQIEGWME